MLYAHSFPFISYVAAGGDETNALPSNQDDVTCQSIFMQSSREVGLFSRYDESVYETIVLCFSAIKYRPKHYLLRLILLCLLSVADVKRASEDSKNSGKCFTGIKINQREL